MAPGRELVEHHADREQVAAGVEFRRHLPLLRRGVEHRAEEVAGL
jgi:hypothetical protein